MASQVFTKKHLAAALKEAGLPYSYPTLLNYERQGIIAKPNQNAEYEDRFWRFYTQEEIDQAVENVRKHLEAQANSRKKK